jgi:hypothetical protein
VRARRRDDASLVRIQILVALLLVLVQSSIGIVVNLYASIPAHHSGAHPGNYLTGSFHSVVWAIGSGTLSLAIHAALGLALVLFAIHVVIRSISLRRGTVTVLCLLAALLAIGAGFNGASFLDFNKDTSSLIMALLAFASIGCYSGALALLP